MSLLFKQFKKCMFLFFALLCFCQALSCAHNKEMTYVKGVQAEYRSYVPARIAVLPCRFWPSMAHLDFDYSSNIGSEEQASLCEGFDSFVLKSFTNQPYMKGFSPKAIQSMLVEKKQENFLSSIDKVWLSRGLCENCSDPLSFYKLEMEPLTAWYSWLNELSHMTKLSDSVLFPFVVFAREEKVNARGLMQSKRSAMLALFLVDSNSGRLIWMESRQHSMRNEAYENTFQSFPEWKNLTELLFSDLLFREFPGRLN